MSKTAVQGEKKDQINPQIGTEVRARISELMAVYEIGQYDVVGIALEYGLWNFKRAWGRYGAVRKAKFKDDDD
ncbi:MAG: hypothetical protein ABSF08_04115 [Candidatus Cybelea sp.]|jgi:hypothetical protein